MELRSILVVDDSELLHQMYDLVLMRYRQKGCSVLHARNGLDALKLLRLHRLGSDSVGLVLLDVNMPVMGGIDMLLRLRGTGWFETGHVIIVSTEGREKDVQRAIELGASGVVTKPFRPADLHQMIERIFPSVNPASAVLSGERA